MSDLPKRLRVVGGNAAPVPRLASVDVGLCRAVLGHGWTLQKYEPGVPGFARLVLYCARCDTSRHDSVSLRTGVVDSRTYAYPKDYHLTLQDHDTRPGKASLRAEALGMLARRRPSWAKVAKAKSA